MDNTTLFLGEKNKIFKQSFNFLDNTTTIYYEPNFGFYVVVSCLKTIHNPTGTQRAVFKAVVNDLFVIFKFQNSEDKTYNLAHYPIYTLQP